MMVRGWPGPARKLASGLCGISGVGLMLAAGVIAEDARGQAPAAHAAPATKAVEALTGFNKMTNGFEDQAAFEKDQETFEEVEKIDPNGLGPVYNATSCVSCHQNPITGSASQISELRVGHDEPDPDDPKKMIFVEPPSGSLIHQRAIDATAQEHARPQDVVRALRMSTSILGDGYIEVIPDADLLKIRDAQPPAMQGLPVAVPVVVGLKKGGGPTDFEVVERLGRFGWKCQEASLVNFAAGAYLNEMGVTSPLQPRENSSNGRDTSQYDIMPDPEDKVDPADADNKEHPFGDDIRAFTRFMRSTKAPPREFAALDTDDVREGEKLFRDNNALGCAICHVPDHTTPEPGSPITALHGGAHPKPGSDLGVVPPALGSKIIHPYSDFLLHDVGTGDGIAQTQYAQRPPRGIENLQKTPDDVMLRDRITRVRARAHAGGRRALGPDVSGLDQRTVNLIRTTPLWGLRARPQLLHDGSALNIDEAIRRHKEQAADVTKKYEKLSADQSRQLLAFLKSL